MVTKDKEVISSEIGEQILSGQERLLENNTDLIEVLTKVMKDLAIGQHQLSKDMEELKASMQTLILKVSASRRKTVATNTQSVLRPVKISGHVPDEFEYEEMSSNNEPKCPDCDREVEKDAIRCDTCDPEPDR